MTDALKCEQDIATIVLLGNFNPAIFQPSWLAANKLIRDEEAKAGSIEVISPMVTSFKSEWLQVQVTDSRFAAASTSPAHHEPLRDLVVAIFALLEHTPVKVMGLNRSLHYRIPTNEKWHAIGHSLVPKDATWRSFMKDPVTRSVSVQGLREGGDSTRVLVKVEPSGAFPNAVLVDCNDHFEPKEATLGMLMQMLTTNWKDSLSYGVRAAEALLGAP